VAAGRKATLEGLNLEAAGVKSSENGIEVNDHLQTSVRSIATEMAVHSALTGVSGKVLRTVSRMGR
jgi:hypothetical protein